MRIEVNIHRFKERLSVLNGEFNTQVIREISEDAAHLGRIINDFSMCIYDLRIQASNLYSPRTLEMAGRLTKSYNAITELYENIIKLERVLNDVSEVYEYADNKVKNLAAAAPPVVPEAAKFSRAATNFIKVPDSKSPAGLAVPEWLAEAVADFEEFERTL